MEKNREFLRNLSAIRRPPPKFGCFLYNFAIAVLLGIGYNGGQCVANSQFHSNMNCTHCAIELPNDAAFCSQCGNPTGNPPVCPPALPLRQHTSTGHGLLIGCVCVAGALMIFFAFIMLAAVALGPPPRPGSSGGGGGRCCGVLPPEPAQVAASTFVCADSAHLVA